MIAVLLLSGCSSLPSVDNLPSSLSRMPPEHATLHQYAKQQLQKQPAGKTAVKVLEQGIDAFVARTQLISDAQDSIDLQYYIWRDDITGKLLALALLEAAERGVRVRVLLDDINTGGMDEDLIALDQHNNIEIRVFNPFTLRDGRLLNFLFDFDRLNHRMHNKLLIADHSFAILGGRNIGDEYFQADAAVDFKDIDLLTFGPIIEQATQSFDDYWNSAKAFPVSVLANGDSEQKNYQDVRSALLAFAAQHDSSIYIEALKKSPILKAVVDDQFNWYWGNGTIIVDDWDKNSAVDSADSLARQLERQLLDLDNELLIISPYFVPGKHFIEHVKRLRKEQVNIHIITNSLAATDVFPVHAGYQKYRRQLLKLGVKLYEFRPDQPDLNDSLRFDITSGGKGSLHAKAIVFDRQRLFIGSFNLDPRSVHINTEIGLLFENAQLSKHFSESVFDAVQERTYQLSLAESNSDLQPLENILWSENTDDGQRTLQHEPRVGPLQSMLVFLLSLLPIESQL